MSYNKFLPSFKAVTREAQRALGLPFTRTHIMNQLLVTCFDLWNAGQDTTANTIAWGIIYLMQEPDVQEKLQKELDSVVGSDRLISLEDKPKLHYTNAVINEIQRLANLIPVIVRHTTTRDVSIGGYKIAKGTEIIPHVSVVLYDDKAFPNPYKFDPNRFLDNNGDAKRIDEFIPFSVGKRQCLGEGLARMELFLFIANIFNQFKINIVPKKPPSLVKKAGGTVAPETFVCQIAQRY